MCKILTIINTKPSNNKVLQDIVNANINDLKMERCGYSIFRENSTKFFLGEEDYKQFGVNAKYNGEKVFCIHSRTSTGGDSNKRGLHLQKCGNWFWGHNGMVSHFAGVKDFSDSYYFFMSLLSKLPIDKQNAPISKELIEKACQDLSFNGKGILYNPKSETLHWFCNAQSFVYLLDGCIIIASYGITLEIEEYTIASILGFQWITSTTKTTIPVLHKEKIDDCLLTFSHFNLVERVDVKLRNWGNQTNNNWRDRGDEGWESPVVIKDYRNGGVNVTTQHLTKRQRKELKRAEKKQNGLVDKDGNYLVREVYPND